MTSAVISFRFVLSLVALSSSLLAAELWEDPAAIRCEITDARLTVSGLAWFNEEKPVLRRLPIRMEKTVPPKVWNLAQSPAGARVRFSTDSLTLAVEAEGNGGPPPEHVTAIANAGLDVYVDGTYLGSAAPDKSGRLRKQWVLGQGKRVREVTLYLAYGRPLSIKSVWLEANAQMSSPRAFAVAKPVVYYGSSITQGIAASNPGGIYQAILGRWTNTDFVNLGFSGNGFGEPELAGAVAEIDASCFVVDYWANPTTTIYRDTLPRFIAILREKHPKTPIIVTGCYWNPSEDVPGDAGARQIEKRVVARDFVAERKAAGDLLITYVDGLEMLSKSEAEGLVDGRHANSMGFYLCARGLEPYLRAALQLPIGSKRR